MSFRGMFSGFVRDPSLAVKQVVRKPLKLYSKVCFDPPYSGVFDVAMNIPKEVSYWNMEHYHNIPDHRLELSSASSDQALDTFCNEDSTNSYKGKSNKEMFCLCPKKSKE
uniref:Uncharacterized protein n=1 Tax=Timema douglasi TaxID=61478 RepID=A0A7R8VGX1_TIMDO|nr:unnamed protein product [Timema douglasi]